MYIYIYMYVHSTSFCCCLVVVFVSVSVVDVFSTHFVFLDCSLCGDGWLGHFMYRAPYSLIDFLFA